MDGQASPLIDPSAVTSLPFRPPRRASSATPKSPTAPPAMSDRISSIPVYPSRGSSSPVPSDSSGTVPASSSGSEWNDKTDADQQAAGNRPLKPQRSRSRPNTSSSISMISPAGERHSDQGSGVLSREARSGSGNFLEEYGLQLEGDKRSPPQSPTSPSGRGTTRFFKNLSITSRKRTVSSGGTPTGSLTTQPQSLHARRVSSPKIGGLGGLPLDNQGDAILVASSLASSMNPQPSQDSLQLSGTSHALANSFPPAVSEADGHEEGEESAEHLIEHTSGERRGSDESRYSALSSAAVTPYDVPDDEASHSASGHANAAESLTSQLLNGDESPVQQTNGTRLSEVDMVRSALASSSTTSFGDSVDFDQQSTASSRWLPSRGASGSTGAFSSAVAPGGGPPALPRRPAPPQQPAVTVPPESEPETKADRKKREAREKIEAAEVAATAKREQKEAAAAAKAEAADAKQRAKEAAAEERAREKTNARIAKDAVVETKARDKENARLAKETAKRNADKKRRDEVEAAILQSSWEDLEVARFLNDFGKHVHEARSIEPVEPHLADLIEWPDRKEWMRSGRSAIVAYCGYTLAWLTAFASYLSPSGATRITRRMPKIGVSAARSPSALPDEGFDLQILRSNTERLYYSAVPLYESIYGTARKLWRWDRFLLSFPLAVAYAFLWWQSLLLPAFFGLQILIILKMRIFPPRPQTLREVLARQQRRHEAIAQLQQSVEDGEGIEVLREAEGAKRSGIPNGTAQEAGKHHRGRYSLAADVTRKYGRQATSATAALADFHERLRNVGLWRSPAATWRFLSLLTVFLLASALLTPAMLVRLPGLVFGLVFFLLGPIIEHRPHWLPTEFVVDPTWLLLAGVPNDAQCAVRILRKRARNGLPLVSDPSLLLGVDLQVVRDAEKDHHEEEGQQGAAQGVVGTVEVKKESMLSKLKNAQGHAKLLAIKGSGILAGERDIYLPRLNPSDEDASITAFLSRNINRGLGQLESQANKSLQSRATQEVDTTSNIDGAYWAVLDGNCGHLIVLPTRLVFRSTFAHKRAVSGAEAHEDAEAVPLIDATTGRAQALPLSSGASDGGSADEHGSGMKVSVRTLLDAPLEHVIGLRKTRDGRLVIWSSDGLEVHLHSGQRVAFHNMLQRDEAFARILAVAPQHWEMS